LKNGESVNNSHPPVARTRIRSTGEKNGVAETPRHHPIRRHAAGPLQDHTIHARKRQEAREGHDDRLHAHDDDHQSEQDLVDHANADPNNEHAQRRRHQSQTVQRNDRDIDEREQWPDGEIDRAASSKCHRHQRIGRKDQGRRHDDRTAKPGKRNQVRSANHRDAYQNGKQQDRNQKIGVLRTPRLRHGENRSSLSEFDDPAPIRIRRRALAASDRKRTASREGATLPSPLRIKRKDLSEYG
jgi:hypothetical protein